MVSDEQMREIEQTLEKEVPGDLALQQLHKARWLNYLKTRSMSREELLKHYNDVKLPAGNRA